MPELLETDAQNNLVVIDPTDVAEELGDAKHRRLNPVLKVHGSVTWRRDGDGIKVVPPGDSATRDPREDPVIGVPGPEKRALIRKILRPLWTAALDVIRSGWQVTFVGYRFPPTDADARKDLLQALLQNAHNGAGLSVRTVLGPAVGDSDSNRLRRLLEIAVSGSVEAIPLFAEDFIGLGGIYGLERVPLPRS